MVGGIAGRKWFSDCERDLIFKLVRAGTPTVDIAAQTDRSRSVIRAIARKAGLTARPPSNAWTTAELDTIVALALDGHNAISISKQLPGRSPNAVRVIAKQHGIRIRPPPRSTPFLEFHIPKRLHARLQELSREHGMSATSTARVIVIAVLRDSWLLENLFVPTLYVEPDNTS